MVWVKACFSIIEFGSATENLNQPYYSVLIYELSKVRHVSIRQMTFVSWI